MKFLILLLTLTSLLLATDFRSFTTTKQYKAMDEKFTLNCDCGIPAKLLPYHGENIPLAKTEPCLSNGCMKNLKLSKP